MAGSKRAIQASRQNNLFYDGIAAEYDFILNHEASNKIVRQKVQEHFSSVVKGSSILDFGGGTGLDIEWMSQNRYQIIFCEPSTAMRKVAMKRASHEYPHASIIFLDGQDSDFRNWDQSFPVDCRVNAVLANFAVLNCIDDIDKVFEKISLILKPEGLFFALVLNSSLKMRLGSNFKKTLFSLISGKSVQKKINYNHRQQLVFLHTAGAIKKAFIPHFEMITSYKLLEFNLLQLKKR